MADPERPAPAHGFRCAGCAAELGYDASAGALRCAYCGASSAVDAPAEEVVARSLEEGLRAAERGLGIGARARACRCRACGATVAFPDGVVATHCTFCGSARMLEEGEQLGAIRPGALVPFSIDRRRAAAVFQRFLRRRWLAPRDLRRLASLEALAGVYVPFWCFDAHVDSGWTALSGRHVGRRDDGEGDDGYGILGGADLPPPRPRRRRRPDVRWTRVAGRRADAFHDLLIGASHGLPPDLTDRLAASSFDTTGLVPYAPGYLAGWRAEAYAIDLQRGYQLARRRMLEETRRRCAAEVPGDTHRHLLVASALSAVRWKHVLLPVWVAAYRYRGRVYPILVSGQSGRVVGRAPWSRVKLVLLSLALALLSLALYRYLPREV